MIKCLQEFVWFMACLIYDFIRYWRRHIQVCLRTIGVSFLDYHLLYPLSEQCRVLSISWTIAVCCMGRDGPRPGASINIQVGSSLTKGGGGQTKNSGKLLSMYIKPHTILASFEYLIHLVVTVVIKTLDKWETDWTLEPLKCRWIRSWCESGSPLERGFEHHLGLQFVFYFSLCLCLPPTWDSRNSACPRCSQTPQTWQGEPLLQSDPLLSSSSSSSSSAGLQLAH